MTADLDKEYLRRVSNKYWEEEIARRAHQKELDPWADLISHDDYKRALEQYFGDLEILKGKKIVDVGAGFGSTLHTLLQDLGVEIVNADVAQESIQLLRGRGEKGFVADAFKLPLADSSLDGVVSVNLINTGASMDLEDTEDIFREFNRVLKDGGVFIQSHWGFLDSPIPKDDQLEVLKKSGFTNIKTIENRATQSISYLEPLSFVAQKS